MSGDLRLRQADTETIGYVESLLERNGLPASDAADKPACFYVASVGDERVGVGGIEVHDTDGLLRSVVVKQSARGNGFGTALCGALERTAREDGVETLYLLTTTAAEFFAARDYITVERAAVPEPIRQTTQFTELCPATATCMQKTLVYHSR